MDQTADGNFPLKVNQYVWEGGDIACEACKFIITNVQKKLKSDNSKEKISQLLNKACDKAGILRQSCKRVIRNSSKKLIDAIAERKSASFTCVQLKYCQ
ncbi:hypothetical protein PAMP_005704 [Pampus punctatissimus]